MTFFSSNIQRRPRIVFILWIVYSIVCFTGLSSLYSKPSPVYRQRVAVIPLGAYIPHTIHAVTNVLGEWYGVRFQMLAEQPMPPQAFYTPRGRWRAEKLLTYLKKIKPPNADFIIGITDEDISTTAHGYEDWGILGQAFVGGQVCICSTHRIRIKSHNEYQYNRRWEKLVLHEFAHAMGLSHCTNRQCIMRDAQGTINTLDEEETLCSSCTALLEQYYSITQCRKQRTAEITAQNNKYH